MPVELGDVDFVRSGAQYRQVMTDGGVALQGSHLTCADTDEVLYPHRWHTRPP